MHEFKKTYSTAPTAVNSNRPLEQTQMQSSSALDPTVNKELEELKEQLNTEKMKISELEVVKEQLEKTQSNNSELDEIKKQLEDLKAKN